MNTSEMSNSRLTPGWVLTVGVFSGCSVAMLFSPVTALVGAVLAVVSVGMVADLVWKLGELTLRRRRSVDGPFD